MPPRTLTFLTFVCASTLGGCGDEPLEESHEGLCGPREQVLTNMNDVPEGFSETAETILGPADSSYTGTLTLTSGEVVPLSIGLVLNRESARARYWDLGHLGIVPCPAPMLTANVDLTIEAGASLSGVAAGGVRTEGGGLSISAPVGAGAAVTSNLMPSFSHEPIDAPTLFTQMGYFAGVWSGHWQWSAPVDCRDSETCTGLELVSLGGVLTERNIGDEF
jgi:hypothetical protein